MYLTAENIRSLNDIILELNTIDDEKEKEQFLKDHTEDTALFLETMKKINKKKLPRKNAKVTKHGETKFETDVYQEEDIYRILQNKNNIEIMDEYSLADLKKMYASGYTKERIIRTLRNRMHSMKRTKAFALLAEEREAPQNRIH